MDNFEDFTNSENPVFGLRLADNADKGIPLVNIKKLFETSYNSCCVIAYLKLGQNNDVAANLPCLQTTSLADIARKF